MTPPRPALAALGLPALCLGLLLGCSTKPAKVAAPATRDEASVTQGELTESREKAAVAAALSQDMGGSWEARGLAPVEATGVWMRQSITRTPTGEPGVYRFESEGELFTRDRVKQIGLASFSGEERFTEGQLCRRYDNVRFTPEAWTSEGTNVGQLVGKALSGPVLDKLGCAALRTVSPTEVVYDLDGLSWTERPVKPTPGKPQ